MKIPSIIKIPKHQRFHIEPRYYDPIKEDIEQRTSRIQKEIDTKNEEGEYYRNPNAISGTFSSKRIYSEKKSSIFQVMIIIDLLASLLVYWEWGAIGVYLLFASMGLLILLRIRNLL